MTTPLHILGDGIAGLLTARQVRMSGRDVVVHGDLGARSQTYTLVHRHAGRSFRTTPLGDDAWAVASVWLSEMVGQGTVQRTSMVRPARSTAGDRLRASLGTAPEVRVEQVPPFGECFVYEPAFVVDVGATLAALATELTELGVSFVDRSAPAPDEAVHATGAELEGPYLTAYGGQLVEFEADLSVAVSGGGVHAVPTPRGVCVGATLWPTSRPMSDDEAVAELQRRASSLGLPTGEVLRVWRGLRCVNELDRRPVIGPLDGRFVVGGLGTRGWFWAPLVAAEASRALVDGGSVREEFDACRLAPQT